MRGADTARLELAPEAAGLLAASLGLSRMYADDLEQLEAGMLLYDAFYRWCRDATGETHNWPSSPEPRDRGGSTGRGAGAGARHPLRRSGARSGSGSRRCRFGGPAGQIAVMHRILVDEKRWIGEARFLHALNFCMLLPGPEAQQLAIYIGWLLHRAWGGVVAGVLFVLPGFVAILALSLVYVAFGDATLRRGRLLRAQGGGARDRGSGGGAHRRAGAPQPGAAARSRRPPSWRSSPSACRSR